MFVDVCIFIRNTASTASFLHSSVSKAFIFIDGHFQSSIRPYKCNQLSSFSMHCINDARPDSLRTLRHEGSFNPEDPLLKGCFVFRRGIGTRKDGKLGRLLETLIESQRVKRGLATRVLWGEVSSPFYL